MKNSQTVQRTPACTTAQDTGLGTKIATAANSVADSQTVSSMSTETSGRNRTDDEVSNFKDFQEPGTAWQDDEHEYETQMKLLKYHVFSFLKVVKIKFQNSEVKVASKIVASLITIDGLISVFEMKMLIFIFFSSFIVSGKYRIQLKVKSFNVN
ncbi:unnamed protein product [Brugia timori]|uniref:Uncharacterized protein n=1 Tax=Brugia timori TaxID=42155 RepID=A0A0R3QY53_9BILA|nr:unnamed protein product [Brugia timori]